MDEDFVFDMEPDGGGEDGSFEVSSLAQEVIYCVTVVNSHCSLGYDRSGVKVGRDVMSGSADDFHASFMGLMVWSSSSESGEEAMVDIDDARGVASDYLLSENLHVAGKDNKVYVFVLQQSE